MKEETRTVAVRLPVETYNALELALNDFANESSIFEGKVRMSDLLRLIIADWCTDKGNK